MANRADFRYRDVMNSAARLQQILELRAPAEMLAVERQILRSRCLRLFLPLWFVRAYDTAQSWWIRRARYGLLRCRRVDPETGAPCVYAIGHSEQCAYDLWAGDDEEDEDSNA